MQMTISSPEFELDRRIERLIGKIVDGSATEQDKLEYLELSKRRSRLMQRNASSRNERAEKLRRLKDSLTV
jgi:hypothetical protein